MSRTDNKTYRQLIAKSLSSYGRILASLGCLHLRLFKWECVPADDPRYDGPDGFVLKPVEVSVHSIYDKELGATSFRASFHFWHPFTIINLIFFYALGWLLAILIEGIGCVPDFYKEITEYFFKSRLQSL